LAASARNRRGELLAEAGKEQDAVDEFEAAITLDDMCVVAIHNRAVARAMQRDFDGALDDFNRVIDLNPTLAIAYRNRGELLSASGKLDEAVSDYTRAIDALSDDAELYRARAHAYQTLGELDRALDDLNRSIQLDPTAAQGLAQRGNIMAERGDFAPALADFKHAIAIDPELADAHRCLTWLYATCPDERYRDSDAAMASADRVRELSALVDYLALEAIAAAYASAGQFDGAVQWQQQAINAAPETFAAAMQERLALYEQKQPYRGEAPRVRADE
jgi:tetratricopeptide (TPR) repeat protein